MSEVFINNFTVMFEVALTFLIIMATFIGTLLLTFKYIDFCFEHIKNYYLRYFVLFIVSPLTLAFLVSFVLSVFGASLAT